MSARKANRIHETAIRRSQHLLWLVAIVTTVKLLVMITIDGGAWLGADGENYTSQVAELWKGGLFVEGLNYWPAGYALTLWVLSVVGHGAMLWVLSTVQTLVWSFAVWLLAREVFRTRVPWAALPLAYLALLNPTLTLSSLTVGYETLAGAMQLIAVALVMQDLRQTEEHDWWRFPAAGVALGYSIALQPRLVLGAGLVLLTWLTARKSWRQTLIRVLVAGIVLSMFPLGLMIRNQVANGRAVISSNLGVNMMMGVGADSTGTYGSESKQVDCGVLPKDPIDADNAKVKCAPNWYVQNPAQTLRLAWVKSVNLWSSWWGPVAAGTMARNPYLNFHPIKALTTTQSAADLVLGPIGKAIEWLWLLGGWVLMLLGGFRLWRLKGAERAIALAGAAIVGGSWAVTLVTFGDHRFRLPVMGLSLFLQVVGLGSVFARHRVALTPMPAQDHHQTRLDRDEPNMSSKAKPGAGLSKSSRRRRR